MIVFGLEVMGEKPFDTVFVHGIVRDSQGRKMSKSLGNGIDPLEVIEKYGADSLRFSLLAGNSAGNDMRFYYEKVEAARNFCNKIYNAARFMLMSADETSTDTLPSDGDLEIADKWILLRLNNLIGEVTANLDSFELGIAAQKVYDFIWTEFCDWYIELAKPRLYGEDKKEKHTVSAVLRFVLKNSLKLLHPFMPFITEELFEQLSNEETIMLSSWPVQQESHAFAAEAAYMDSVMDLIRSIRNVRAEMKVAPSQRIQVRLIVPKADETIYQTTIGYFSRLAGAEKVSVSTEAGIIPGSDIHVVCQRAEAVIPLSSMIDVDKEKTRIAKEMERVKGDIARSEGKLNSSGFVAKAPEKVVEEERDKLQTAQEMLKKLEERLTFLS